MKNVKLLLLWFAKAMKMMFIRTKAKWKQFRNGLLAVYRQVAATQVSNDVLLKPYRWFWITTVLSSPVAAVIESHFHMKMANAISDPVWMLQVRRWLVIPQDFSVQGGELSPSLKLKRPVSFRPLSLLMAKLNSYTVSLKGQHLAIFDFFFFMG
jgi:hypothetical protein